MSAQVSSKQRNNSVPPPPPGLSSAASSSNTPNAWNKPLQPVDPALRARYLSLLWALVGQKVTLKLVNKHTYTGVLHMASPVAPFQYVLKATLSSTDQAFSKGTTLVIDTSQVVTLHCKSVKLDTHRPAAAFSDSEIATRATPNHNHKPLQKPDESWTVPSKVDLSGDIGKWDQFKANKELFNVNASFDENIYTTSLDKSKISKDQLQHAEKIAKEIESTTTRNMHLAEERNQAIQHDYDEEDKYSGVLHKMNYAKITADSAVTSTTETTTTTAAAANTPTTPAPAKKEEPTPEQPKKAPEENTTPPVAKVTPTSEAAASPPEKEPAPTQKPEDKPKTKLNANAKEFTFNPNTPAFTPNSAAPPQQQQHNMQQHMYGADPYLMQQAAMAAQMYHHAYNNPNHHGYYAQYGYGMPPPPPTNMHHPHMQPPPPHYGGPPPYTNNPTNIQPPPQSASTPTTQQPPYPGTGGGGGGGPPPQGQYVPGRGGGRGGRGRGGYQPHPRNNHPSQPTQEPPRSEQPETS